jgi:hypothetical protein
MHKEKALDIISIDLHHFLFSEYLSLLLILILASAVKNTTSVGVDSSAPV